MSAPNSHSPHNRECWCDQCQDFWAREPLAESDERRPNPRCCYNPSPDCDCHKERASGSTE